MAAVVRKIHMTSVDGVKTTFVPGVDLPDWAYDRLKADNPRLLDDFVEPEPNEAIADPTGPRTVVINASSGELGKAAAHIAELETKLAEAGLNNASLTSQLADEVGISRAYGDNLLALQAELAKAATPAPATEAAGPADKPGKTIAPK